MNIRPTSSAAPPSRAEPQRGTDRPTAELVERFKAAVGRRELPLPARPETPASARNAPHPQTGLKIPLPNPPKAGHWVQTDPGQPWRKPPHDPESPEIALFSGTPQTVPAPVTPPPSAPVDASAFADMMNQLWLREQHRQTREMKVRFGDAAWPATGASLLRRDDGSLSITVDMAAHGRPGDLDQLRQQLENRGLPIADLAISTDR